MLKSAYEGLNARPNVYLLKEYFCEMYPTCVSSKLCEFISHRMSFFKEGFPKCFKKVVKRQLADFQNAAKSW